MVPLAKGENRNGATDIPEYATIVKSVKNNDETVRQMELLCRYYDANDLAEMKKGLQTAFASANIDVRNFAMQTTVIRLGMMDTNEALKIIHERALTYKADESGEVSRMNERECRSLFYCTSQEFISYFKPEALQIQYLQILSRSLVAMSQTEIKSLRRDCICILANFITEHTKLDIRSTLTLPEVDILKSAIEKTSNSDDKTLSNSITILKKYFLDKIE